MTKDRPNQDEEIAELRKYFDLVTAAIDYSLENPFMKIETADFDSYQHYMALKIQAEEHFQKSRLTKLKQWFRDLTEMYIESGDLKFNQYLKNKTIYQIDIFESYFKCVDQIVENGKITSESQFYKINSMVDQLCQIDPVDSEKIEKLNKLLRNYEQRKTR